MALRRGFFLLAFLLAGLLISEALWPSVAWAPPPPPPRRRPLVRPRVVPVPVPVPRPKAVLLLKNLLYRPLDINLPGGRSIHLDPRGTVPISSADLEAPEVKAHIKRGEVRVVRIPP